MIDIRQFEAAGHQPSVIFTPKKGERWFVVAKDLLTPLLDENDEQGHNVYQVAAGSQGRIQLFPYLVEPGDPVNLFGAAIQIVSNVIHHVPPHSELLWILGHPAMVPAPATPNSNLIRIWMGLAYLVER
jgi:hypothetical protein